MAPSVCQRTYARNEEGPRLNGSGLETTVAIKQFLLFTAASDAERKMFIASFESSDEAVQTAKKLKGDSPMRWQVIDSVTATCVAEHRGEPMH